MGYETDYNGTIKLSKEGVKKLKELNKDGEDFGEDFELEGIIFDGKEIGMGGYGRLYGNEIEKFCLFIAMLDKKCKGEIVCSGEDSFDKWKIVISNGKIEIKRGKIIYHKDCDFEDTGVKKKVYEITKDKKLMREIMVDELK